MQSAQGGEINTHKRIRTGMHKHTYMQSAKGGEINPVVAGHKMTAIYFYFLKKIKTKYIHAERERRRNQSDGSGPQDDSNFWLCYFKPLQRHHGRPPRGLV